MKSVLGWSLNPAAVLCEDSVFCFKDTLQASAGHFISSEVSESSASVITFHSKPCMISGSTWGRCQMEILRSQMCFFIRNLVLFPTRVLAFFETLHVSLRSLSFHTIKEQNWSSDYQRLAFWLSFYMDIQWFYTSFPSFWRILRCLHNSQGVSVSHELIFRLPLADYWTRQPNVFCAHFWLSIPKLLVGCGDSQVLKKILYWLFFTVIDCWLLALSSLFYLTVCK